MSVDDDDVIIVAAGNKPGRSFIETLKSKGLSFAIIESALSMSVKKYKGYTWS
ncbi:hypothetical protein ACFQ3J_19485 [Paenibacillus provencensis]|uniref:Uncharacterized protein n=1 Tax=Paenibacillus provencensis TaxID=441151 RepID=A0ABW3PYH7_9BACL|nr:hypothetical protein [Paenibacillus sp. MER 78]